MIQLQNINKSFNGLKVLDSLSLEISTGETMLVLGRSGCGKSVLLKIILRLILFDAGKIIVDETDTSDFTEEEMIPVRKKIGMLFQGAALFDSMTVGQNLAYPLVEHTKFSSDEINERVKEMLRFVEMDGTEEKMPSELSGGMKKRVALARAMIMHPDYLFYDEPTTGLDPITANTINDLIIRTQKKYNVTSIVVTHDLVSAFKVGNRFSFIHDGKICFTGSKEEFLNNKQEAIKSFLSDALWKTI
ncbi:ATP-binding cassette domain-containing protein [bacterium]|nr:ATP-binding cassette domain-containing protein [bacterium]